MAIEGVLTEELPVGANLLHYESSIQGKELYRIFQDTTRLLMLSQDPDRDRVKAWMARERFSRYADVHCYPEDSLSPFSLWKVEHIRELMGVGHHIAFYIDGDPTAVSMVLEEGVGALLAVRPGDTPGKKDDMSFTPWLTLVDTIEAQNLLRAEKTVEADYG